MAEVVVVTFERIARDFDLRVQLDVPAPDELVDVLRAFAGLHLRSREFEVQVEGETVFVSSGKPGFDRGDFGRGRILERRPA